MAAIFHTRLAVNSSTGNWVALPALPTGLDPMRRILMRGEAAIEVGVCTVNQSTRDAGTITSSGSGNGFHIDLGVVNYNTITVRSQATSTNVYIMSFAPMDEGPMGF
jgi:hypothetical protein